jgi:hypothetical protein
MKVWCLFTDAFHINFDTIKNPKMNFIGQNFPIWECVILLFFAMYLKIRLK